MISAHTLIIKKGAVKNLLLLKVIGRKELCKRQHTKQMYGPKVKQDIETWQKRMLVKVKELMRSVNYAKCRNRTTQVRRSI